MRTYNRLYSQIISFENLILAWKKARKGRTQKDYVIEFEQEPFHNLMALHYELKYGPYKPKPLTAFVVRDPKTRLIHKSYFHDCIVHHAIVNILEPIFDKVFIHDSYANRKGKGNLSALKRFQQFIRKVSRNGKINGWFDNNQIKGYCLKADIFHYFQEVNTNILMKIIKRRITDRKVLWLIEQVLANSTGEIGGANARKECLSEIRHRSFLPTYILMIWIIL